MGAIPPEVNAASLRLFSSVAYHAASTTRDDAAEYLLKKEIRMLVKYQVVINPDAFYAINLIEAHVKRTGRTVKKPNSLLYRRWIEFISQTNIELLRDQLIHYVSTHDATHTGPVHIPATAIDLDLPAEGWKIDAFGTLEQDELKERCWSLISGESTLMRQTVADCVQILDWTKAELDISKVRNQDARTLIIARDLKDGPIDCEPEELLRAAIYTATGELLVIKNDYLLDSIKCSERNEVAQLFTSYGVDKLASIFNRHKPFFIAFKLGNSKNVSVINRISKRSKSTHKPLAQNPLNSVTHRLLSIPSEYHWLESATVSAQLRALNACHMAIHEQHGFVYNIRNSSSWVADRTRSRQAREISASNFKTILSYLQETIGFQFRNKRIYIPDWVEYGIPTSEKQFIGNVPFGTRFKLPSSKSLVLGISWQDKCRYVDLSLSNETAKGENVCDNMKDSFECSYSTTGHGGYEYILCKSTNKCENMFIEVCAVGLEGNYTDYEYDIIIGEGGDMKPNFVINSAKKMARLRHRIRKDMPTIGYLHREAKYTEFVLSPSYFQDFATPIDAHENIAQLMENSLKHKLNHTLSLNWLLSEFGAIVVDQVAEGEKIDFDLTLENIERGFFDFILEDWVFVGER